MDILLLLIGLVVELLAVPLLLIALIWFFFVGRRFYREKKSLDAVHCHSLGYFVALEGIKALFFPVEPAPDKEKPDQRDKQQGHRKQFYNQANKEQENIPSRATK
ncbi:hypothetical protein [Bilophila wadsworthia]|uniref:hypothetical protein n=1 Tax=Bilophila wadsworthia TaxID=35833 RepID=UPI00242C01DC|nr:hypothetical protein [Bilophila wadsworthia]